MTLVEFKQLCEASQFVTVTDDMLIAGQSRSGGWSMAQLELLGFIGWPPPRGWKRKTIGRTMPGAVMLQFLNLKGNSRE